MSKAALQYQSYAIARVGFSSLFKMSYMQLIILLHKQQILCPAILQLQIRWRPRRNLTLLAASLQI